MSRLFLLPLALAVGACSSASGLEPEAAVEAAHAAAANGEPRRALALLDEAAADGDLDALRLRAEVLERGYFRVPVGYVRGQTQTNVAFWAAPWRPGQARRAFDRALRDGADAGDPDALFALADALADRQFVDGEWVDGDRDSARAVYRRLEADGADDLRLAFLAQRLDDDAGWRAHLEAAADAGKAQACIFLTYAGSAGSPFTAARLADQIDTFSACRERAGPGDPGPQFFDVADHSVRSLAEAARAGNAASVATLDSLRQLGVFERHPHLAPLAEAATDA